MVIRLGRNGVMRTMEHGRQESSSSINGHFQLIPYLIRHGPSGMAQSSLLLSVSSLPKSDLFILDEPGTALDEENMEGFIRILELIKVYFKNVLLISHLDSLKDCVDMQIVIEKKAGYARVNQ